MKDSRQHGIPLAIALVVSWVALGLGPVSAQTAIVPTGAGTNRCLLIVNFPAGEKVVFQHHWNGTSLNAKTLLESIIGETGGELVVSEDDYLTPFALIPMTNPNTPGLVVHYQGSYEIPYINAIRWNGPDGPAGADYQSPENWWHLWVRGPAHVDQSFGLPPLPPVNLSPSSAWFFGGFSGLADLNLYDGASLGLVYGSASQPSLPPPTVRSVVPSSRETLQLQFSSVPGARYQLETRQDLNGGTWTPSGEPILATASNTTISVPVTPAGRGFYRLGILP